jgi:hypothetical protein
MARIGFGRVIWPFQWAATARGRKQFHHLGGQGRSLPALADAATASSARLQIKVLNIADSPVLDGNVRRPPPRGQRAYFSTKARSKT